MKERPTPETDALTLAYANADAARARDAVTDSHRNLERQRDELREELEKLRYALRGSQQGCEDAQKAIRRMERKHDDLLELARELRDALAQCREDSAELKGEWEWKRKNSGQRNERQYFEVECHVEMADAALTKANQLLS